MAKVIIIGGGIIGLSSSYYLRRAGHEVTVLDKGKIEGNCSYGNAGMIVPSHFVPLAAPGMVQQGIRWMFNRKSPFYVKPSLNFRLISWGLKFLAHANSRHVEQSAVPLRDLSLLSKRLYDELAMEPGFDFGLKHRGILAFYKTEQAAEEEAHLVANGRALGLDMEILSAARCRALQPGLELDVLGAAHYRCDAHISPNRLMALLQENLVANDVVVVEEHGVSEVISSGGRIRKIIAGGREFEADEYVIAAGSWSPEVGRMFGLNIPLMPGKGYSFMEKDAKRRLQIPALLCEARVAVTPMDGSIRYGGTMELGKLNRQVNLNRVRGIAEAVPKYFPGLRPLMPAEKDIWYGFRPASPDGLPYIGRSARLSNLVIATGHGMMGLSLGPATGKLVSEVIAGEITGMDIGAFSPER
ncbi:NAD(P)/FAD-dependent oxidoreductase [Hufsiella ginkgonis]|uniref:FAD-dependent oxidoreductase n=1 Tax=Hufsiella ginkgonis TaxID=2695274 RepID=A0A7K1Y1Y5_9SPHI|nr:FAD-dependent oxidoreductase [Hufsiella ginkgonis]MXV17264.1 FAD-dependent oxidoreductase [Hufsiella ginkgonis]